MNTKFEAPELILVGNADEVVMGSGKMGMDVFEEAAPDFEFEQD